MIPSNHRFGGVGLFVEGSAWAVGVQCDVQSSNSHSFSLPVAVGSSNNRLGIHVYDTDAEKVSWGRILKESLTITVLADVMFYGLHRLMHTPRFYQRFHKKHHEFKYTIAFARRR